MNAWWFPNYLKQMFCSENDPRVAALRRRLDKFYSMTRDYPAFEGQNHKPEYWQPIKAVVEEWLNRSGHCRILEFGAGCTGFGAYLGDIRRLVTFEVQDVTAANQEYLSQQADRVYICDILEIQNNYDIMFSTFNVRTPYRSESGIGSSPAFIEPWWQFVYRLTTI